LEKYLELKIGSKKSLLLTRFELVLLDSKSRVLTTTLQKLEAKSATTSQNDFFAILTFGFFVHRKIVTNGVQRKWKMLECCQMCCGARKCSGWRVTAL